MYNRKGSTCDFLHDVYWGSMVVDKRFYLGPQVKHRSVIKTNIKITIREHQEITRNTYLLCFRLTTNDFPRDGIWTFQQDLVTKF